MLSALPSHTPKSVPLPSHHCSTVKRRWTCRSHCSIWCEAFLLGVLLLGLVLTIILLLWLTSKNSDSIDPNRTSSSSPSVTTTAAAAASSCWTWTWNSTGETILGTTSTSGTGLNQLSSPWNLFIDPTNPMLYIADSQNHRIQRIPLSGSSTATTVAGQTGSPGSSSTQLNGPKDLFLDSSQNLYVADSSNGRIQYFPSGNLNGQTVSSAWTNVGELWGVQLFNNFIYSNDKVKSVLWRNGTNLTGNFLAGSSAHQLNGPQGFAIDTTFLPGTLFIVNSQQHTVVQWPVGARNGSVVAGTDGVQGSSGTTLRYPVSMKLDSDANMFVVDNNNHRIQLYCRNSSSFGSGRTIVGTGSLGNDTQRLNFPAGVALDAAGNLFVSDTSNHRIQKFLRLV